MPDRSHTYLELSNKTQSRLKILETVLNSISEGFIVVDNSGRIVERNAAAIRMGGFPDLDRTKEFNEKLNEIIEISKLDGTIVPYEDWAVNRTLRGEEFSNVELKLTRKDKPFSIILSYSGVSIKDENGKVELGVISFADITERKQAEETVIKRAQEYRAIFDSAATANVQIDVSDKKFVRVNKRMCEMTGYSTAELLNMHAFDLVHPDERDADMKAYDDFVTGVSQEYSREKRYIRKDGRIIWVNVISSMVRDDKGNPVVTIGSIHDITKNKEFENTLRKRADEYKSVFELTGSGKAQIEPKTGKFLRVNRKLCSMLGYTAEELRQKTLFDITYPEDLQK